LRFRERAADEPNPKHSTAVPGICKQADPEYWTSGIVNLKPLNRKVRQAVTRPPRDLRTAESGLVCVVYFPPITSFAMVANCMLDVPS
jgi:hypothetical protein